MSLTLAVLNWLAEVPGSPFSTSASVEQLKCPSNLVTFLKLFVNKEDLNTQKDREEGHNAKLVPQEFRCVDSIITSFWERFRDKDVYMLQTPINWNLVVEGDENELDFLCGTMLKVATNSLTISSLAYATIEFLDEKDKMVIRNYLNLPYHDSLSRGEHENKVKSMIEQIENNVSNMVIGNSRLVSRSGTSIVNESNGENRSNIETKSPSKNPPSFHNEQDYVNDDFIRALIFENMLLEKILYRVTR